MVAGSIENNNSDSFMVLGLGKQMVQVHQTLMALQHQLLELILQQDLVC